MLYTEKQWKLEKQNQCEICKQQKRLYKIYIKTKIYVAQNIGQKFGCNT